MAGLMSMSGEAGASLAPLLHIHRHTKLISRCFKFPFGDLVERHVDLVPEYLDYGLAHGDEIESPHVAPPWMAG